jgi:parvulin-like peptidyl-prolyl isomerase
VKIPGFEITPVFGPEFAAALVVAPVGEWVGPVSSKLGLHIIHVDDRVAGRIPELAEVRVAVEEKWAAVQRTAAVEDMYQRLEERYRVTKE